MGTRGCFPRSEMTGRETDHSPSSAEVENAWGYTSTPSCVFMAWYLFEHRDSFILSTRDVWKVRGLTLLLRVWTLCMCGDSLFFEVTSLGKRCTSYNAPPTSRKRAADRWSLRNFLPRSSCLFVVGKAQKSYGGRCELYGGCSNGVPPIHFFQTKHRIQFAVRSTSLANGGTSKKRPSPHLHKVPSQINKVSPRT
jgi:hypothetical protein